MKLRIVQHSHKRQAFIDRNNETMRVQSHMNTWTVPTTDWQLRLSILTTFNPNKSIRQNFNLGKLNNDST